jgi:excisionase family DNA binding protein
MNALNPTHSATGDKPEEKLLDKVVPTLFIGAGGTGAEVLWRIRRRILNRVWRSSDHKPYRVKDVADFPFARFIHFDLDTSTVVESGKSSDDPLSAAVAFTQAEKLVKKFDVDKYVQTQESLDRHPLVKEWFPLTPAKVRELNINLEKGTGQIRSMSRLYFFDQYQQIKQTISLALSELRESISNESKHKRLGLTLAVGELRVVVVASTAGGTGSGAALDLGYLSKALLSNSGVDGKVNFIWLLPTGYSGANKARTQANTYAALMELETAMRGMGHARAWSENDRSMRLPPKPYDDVYLLDTENVAYQKTGNIADCYEMVADVLFEDFSTSEFANRKRSIAVNQNQHKLHPYSPRLSPEKYGDMRLSYNRSYSVFGQAIVDLQVQQKLDCRIERDVSAMLGAFFGVALDQKTEARSSQPESSNELLVQHLGLQMVTEGIEYIFASKDPAVKHFRHYELVQRIGHAVREQTETEINQAFEVLKNEDYKSYPLSADKLIKHYVRSVELSAEPGSGERIKAVAQSGKATLAELLRDKNAHSILNALWARVDNKQEGGLDYTIDLIQRLRDAILNRSTGAVARLKDAEKDFEEVAGFFKTQEIVQLQDHLGEAVQKLFGAAGTSSAKLTQLAEALKHTCRYRLQQQACRSAAEFLQQVAATLGEPQGVDEYGETVYSGLIGELQSGRQAVAALMRQCSRRVEVAEQAMSEEHAMYVRLQPDTSSANQANPSQEAQQSFKAWAEDAFNGLGGSRELFARLMRPDEAEELISLLRNVALNQRDHLSKADAAAAPPNPLFSALRAAGAEQTLAKTMQRAMPWAAIDLDGGYLAEGKEADQYKCVVGVKDAEAFKKDFAHLLVRALPTASKMTEQQMGYVEISEPGRLICYVELSGIPLPALRLIDNWYDAYFTEKDALPIHTHWLASKFIHAREFTDAELDQRKADLKLMLQGLMLRVLTRSSRARDHGELSIKIGEDARSRSVGNERGLRMNGLTSTYREPLQQQVEDHLSYLQSPEQACLWQVLLQYTLDHVYPVKIRKDYDQGDVEEHHLPTKVCEELLDEARKRVQRHLLADIARDDLLRRCRAQLLDWSEEIDGSDQDPYPDELGPSADGGSIKPKRALRAEVFNPGWTLLRTDGAPAASAPVGAGYAGAAVAAAHGAAVLPAAAGAAGAVAGAGGVAAFLTPEDVARELQLDLDDVMAALESGDLKGKKIGKSWRISREQLNTFMNS